MPSWFTTRPYALKYTRRRSCVSRSIAGFGQFCLKAKYAFARSDPTHPRTIPFCCKTLIRIIGSQREPVFGARREHTIRLADPLRGQIVDHDSDIGFGPVQHRQRLSARPPRCIDARQKTLRGRLLISRRAVNLTGQENAARGPSIPKSDQEPADRYSRIRSRSPGGGSEPARALEWSGSSPAEFPQARTSKFRSGRWSCCRFPPARGKSGAVPDRRIE